MKYLVTTLILSVLALLPPALAQPPEPAAPPSGEHSELQLQPAAPEPGAPAEHAEGPDHAEHAEAPEHAEQAEAPEQAEEEHGSATVGRPRWAWPAILLLLVAAGGDAGCGAARRAPSRGHAHLCAVRSGRLRGLRGDTAERVRGTPGRIPDEHAGEQAEGSPFIEVDPEAAAALGLQTETASPAEFATSLSATGRIVTVEAREAHLGSRIAGRLTAVNVKVGERVEAGQAVAALDSVDAAQAAAMWREANAHLDSAQRNLANRRELVASGSFTVAPVEDARRQLADARVEHAKAASALAQAQNEAETAKAELSRTERLVASGAFTTAAEEDARQRLAEAERGLAEARSAVADAEANQTEAAGAVEIARQRVAGAESLATRTASLAATGELDRGPLEQAQNALADVRAGLQESTAALDQARRQAQRGEELFRHELISLNDLESRRTAVAALEAQHREAASAVTNATAALQRQETISQAKMTSGRAEQEATNAVAEARREQVAAEARAVKAQARVAVVRSGVAPAEAAVEAARSALQRERTLAGDQTRSQTALGEARLRVAQADRTVQGNQREVAEAAGKVKVAAAGLQREERLASGQVRGREQLLDAESAVRAARIGRDNAAEMLQLLGASTRSASGARGPVQIPIRSPLSGLVTSIDATVGEAISAEANLMSVVDLSEVYLEADIYEKDLPRIQEGQAVRVMVRAYPGEPVLGSVVSISGQLDPETRAAHVRALLPNPGWRLRPEMFATVDFITARSAGALTVPEEAVQEVEGRTVVFVQRTPEQFEVRPVELGRRDETRVEVLSGLSAGEQFVTAGSYLLKSQRLKGELGEGHAH